MKWYFLLLQISRKLRYTTEKMEEQLRAEQAARLEAEKARLRANKESRKLIEKLKRAEMETKKAVEKARLRADEESRQLRAKLDRAKMEAEELRRAHAREAEKSNCSIL
ncbi:hypothetical protein LINPERPRIM_LOCUS4563 [Linum perenne]